MTWNYRIIHLDLASSDEPWYAIHEVYYDEAGKITGYTEQASSVGSEDIAGIISVLDMMKEATSKPVLVESELQQHFNARKRE